MNEYTDIYTKERRRMTCIHEAGHAVIYSLGGDIVDKLAVAPEGCTSWSITSRRGLVASIDPDVRGICYTKDYFGAMKFVEWDGDERCYLPKTEIFKSYMSDTSGAFNYELRMIGSKHFGGPAAIRTRIRAEMCGLMAGTFAARIYLGEEIDESDFLQDNCNPDDDIDKALGLRHLLPWRFECENAARLTEQALRIPSIWADVLALADELENQGTMEDFGDLLPGRIKGWPYSPQAKIRDLDSSAF